MTTREHTPLHVSAAILGGTCLLVSVWANVDHLKTQAGSYLDPTIAAIFAVTIANAVMLASAMAAFRAWNIVNGIALVLGFLVGSAFEVTTTLERVALMRDQAQIEREADDRILQALVSEHSGLVKMRQTECVGGFGPRCGYLDTEEYRTKMAIKSRRSELDSGGQRIAAYLGGTVTPQQASLYQPGLLPIALFLGANFLFAFGIGGQTKPPEFNVGLTGRAALNAKAERFADQFQATHGRMPQSREIEQALGVTVNVARRLAREVAVA